MKISDDDDIKEISGSYQLPATSSPTDEAYKLSSYQVSNTRVSAPLRLYLFLDD